MRRTLAGFALFFILAACEDERARARRRILGPPPRDVASLQRGLSVMQSGRPLAVRVFDRGKAVAGAIGTSGVDVAISGTDGFLRFSFAPARDAVVEVAHGERYGRGTFGPGATGTITLHEHGVVSGTVVDANGRPASDVAVALRAGDSRFTVGRTTIEGEFAVRIPGASRWDSVDLEVSGVVVHGVAVPSEGLLVTIP